MSSAELLLLIVLALLSAGLSASEVALFSLSRFQLRSLKDTVPSAYRRVKRLLADPPGILLTILVLNELVNIGFSVLTTHILGRLEFLEGSPGLQAAAGILVATPAILFFCEISPKVTAARLNLLVLAVTLRWINIAYLAMAPVRRVLQFGLRFFSKWILRTDFSQTHVSPLKQERAVRESDILMMAEKGALEGIVDQSELELLKKIFELDDTTASEVLRPLSQLVCLPSTLSAKEALRVMQSRKTFRAPVFEGTRTNIVGVLYAKDLIAARLRPEKGEPAIGQLMREPTFTDPDSPLERLFRSMSREKKHIAIVREPRSGTALGVVTMDDVLYELFDHALGGAQEKRG